ncbi:lipopolysaccharide biosynthesis protein [Pontibacter harenae]|uniref:lipopolysaccharide biosynthesis protein n=1 Tax=Pontibacter harenae TaxID=2894083 RepID=UPI001E3CDFB5|nr:oligosaccharide flippase family protein [Pontibacter harenae]MCC9165992.1 oligosaccharide flippase family protein [Pontibacter harenae]
MLRKLISHAAIYGLAAQMPRMAGVLVLPIITQYLTPADYGVAGVVLAYVSALAMLQSLGLSVVLVNSFSRYPTRFRWIWRQLYGFISVWALLYGVLMGVVIFFLVPEEAAAHRLQIALLYCLPIMFFSSTETQASLFYQLSQRPFPIALRSFVVGAVGVSLNLYTIAYLKLGYMGWFYAHFFSLASGFLLNSYYVYVREKLWPIFNFRWHRIVSSLKVSLPVVPHSLSFIFLDTSDRLVMDVLGVPLRRIGLYNVASSFGGYFMIASGAIVQAASPFYFSYYAQRTKSAAIQARNMTFAMQLLFLLATTGICLWMKEIFVLLIRNEALQQAYPIAIIILMGYNFRPLYTAVINFLTYHEFTGKLWKISGVAAAGNIVLNFILVPIWGIEAAAFTTFAALMYMGFAGYMLKEYRELAMAPYYPGLWLVLIIVALCSVYMLMDIAFWYKVNITAAAGLIAVGVFLVYRKRLGW